MGSLWEEKLGVLVTCEEFEDSEEGILG